MADDLLDLGGIAVPPGALTLSRAGALARLVGSGRLPYARLVECRRISGDGEPREAVAIDVEVERPQVMVHELRRTERIAAVFHAGEGRCPEALALRASFPRAPHQNATATALPRSLCLYDRPWPEVAIRWTPAAFVERVRYWLAQTARGRLHQDDQPLEPLLFDGGNRIVLPAELLDDLTAATATRLDVYLATDRADCKTLVAINRKAGDREAPALKFVATAFVARPQTHGIVRNTPATLAELDAFLAAGGIDLVGGLRERLADWEMPAERQARLVIIVALPLARADGAAAERWDFWSFATLKTVRDVGVAVGLWSEVGGVLARELPFNDADRGNTVPLLVLSPYVELTRAGAAKASGLQPDARTVVAVGAGALGSHVVDVLARSGFGNWTIVDEDDLLPHNLARHVLLKYDVGGAKAVGLADHLNRLYREDGGAKAIVADVLSPGADPDALTAAFAAADVILDCAASVPVARQLAAGIESAARRLSVFLNPTGTDVVVLAEPADRSVPLDAIEAQYYRAAATDARLAGHLGAAAGRLRYGRSCRDITTELPAHLVAMHAAIASAGVRAALASEAGSVRIWRCHETTMGVTPVEVQPNGAHRRNVRDWTLVIDDALLGRLAGLRAAKLPNETGGVLIGVYDLSRQTVYVVDTIPSPPDSKEWPTLYIRGSEGLLTRVNELTAASGGQLEYVGEWHSHPDGCSTMPSQDDMTVFAWLTDHLAVDGLPSLMAIAGERGGSTWYLGAMDLGTGWDVTHGVRGTERDA